MHRGRADLDAPGSHGNELRRIPPDVPIPPMPLIGKPAQSRAMSPTMRSAIGFTAGPQYPPCVPQPVHHRFRRHAVQVHGGNGGDGVDQAHRVCPAAQRRACGLQDVRDIRRQLHDHRQVRRAACTTPSPSRRIPAPGRPPRPCSARTCHAGSRKFSSTPSQPGILHGGAGCDCQALLLAGHHQAHHHRPVRPIPLDLRDLGEVDGERPVRDQLDVAEPGDARARRSGRRRSGC